MSETREIPIEHRKVTPPKADTEIPSDDARDQTGSLLLNLGSSAPDTVVQKIKDQLKTQETVDNLMAEREAILRQLEESLQYFSTKDAKEITQEQVASRSNFRGDWSVLTKQRLEHPIGFTKYTLLKLRHIETLKPGSPNSFLEKASDFRQYVFDQIQQYEDVLNHVFEGTSYVDAKEKSKLGSNFGVGKYGEQPTVFKDAANEQGVPLDDHQKHIIESHEAGHGIREFVGTEGNELHALLDLTQIPQRSRHYLSNPAEVAERMGQIKNYFGLGPTEDITLDHLSYAREHYVSDTGLDNKMSEFFAGITPAREPAFIRLINELPI
jgi:hypothetical protein